MQAQAGGRQAQPWRVLAWGSSPAVLAYQPQRAARSRLRGMDQLVAERGRRALHAPPALAFARRRCGRLRPHVHRRALDGRSERARPAGRPAGPHRVRRLGCSRRQRHVQVCLTRRRLRWCKPAVSTPGPVLTRRLHHGDRSPAESLRREDGRVRRLRAHRPPADSVRVSGQLRRNSCTAGGQAILALQTDRLAAFAAVRDVVHIVLFVLVLLALRREPGIAGASVVHQRWHLPLTVSARCPPLNTKAAPGCESAQRAGAGEALVRRGARMGVLTTEPAS